MSAAATGEGSASPETEDYAAKYEETKQAVDTALSKGETLQALRSVFSNAPLRSKDEKIKVSQAGNVPRTLEEMSTHERQKRISDWRGLRVAKAI